MPGTSRDFAFCAHTILGKDLLIVPDATRDPRFLDNPLVTGPPGIRFYAGVPLFSEGGEGAVGSLCSIDVVPRALDTAQRARLAAMAAMAAIVVDLLELRRGSLVAEASERRATEAEIRTERQATLLRANMESVEHGLAAFDADAHLLVWNERF